METNKEIITILNDLVRINNDRVAGYSKAIVQLKEGESALSELFLEFVQESNDFSDELKDIIEVELAGDAIAGDTTISGKIYRVWMDVEATFTGHSTQSIIDACEFGENTALEAYQTALKEENIPSEIYIVINDQQQALKEAHDKIRSLKEKYAVK